ncbi:transmembrane protein 192 [Oncorhynchus tshawytscha]|uniref:Transmembrane protein 192 n=1 Tax=Oncorhynchus mykiss TaxID=8022 RepID=A0A8L0DK51_ONCMY|nr:transmembrane protein 192-like [Oncorhynchus mykiss]XP_042172929.1 transmembrane protein 192 [Oncorhynchus tshawytscha]
MESEGMSHHAVSSSVDVSQSVEEDPLVDGPLISHDALQSAIRREFTTLPTHCPAVLLLLLQVVYVSLSVCVAVVCVFEVGREECVRVLGNVRGQSVVVIGKVFVWLCVLLFGVCVQHHHSRVRSRGYLRFYRDNRTLKHLPFLIHSAGNTAVLVVMSADLPEADHLPVYLLLGILGLELLVSLPCLIIYTVRVVRFNRDRAGPDISQEEPSNSYNTTETGFREGSSLEEVVEKQADLIDYLKQHNTLLSKRLLNMTVQH